MRTKRFKPGQMVIDMVGQPQLILKYQYRPDHGPGYFCRTGMGTSYVNTSWRPANNLCEPIRASEIQDLLNRLMCQGRMTPLGSFHNSDPNRHLWQHWYISLHHLLLHLQSEEDVAIKFTNEGGIVSS